MAVARVNGANFVVEMRNFAFVPQELAIERGDSVTWTNLDGAFHDTTSGVGGVPDGVWRGPLISRGGAFTFTFDVAPRRYAYYCTPHVGLGMVGGITVRERAEGPSILTQPRSQSVFPGESVSFSVAATGAAPLLYQWNFGGTVIPGATNESYMLSAVATNDAGSYTVAVRNAAGSITSSSAVLTVLRRTNAPPTVTLVQPVENSRVMIGAPTTLEAQASAPAGVVTSVEFFASGALVGIATNSPYTVSFQPTEVGQLLLHAVATDDLGQRGTSAPVRIVSFAPENRRPVVRITRSPPNYSRLTAPVALLEGTALDDVGVERVEIQVNGGPFEPASGTAVWRMEVPLAPGNNIVLVRALDWAGNQSLPVSRYLTLLASGELRVNVVGDGKVTPHLDGRSLQIGSVYALRAVPAAGHLFAGWSGGVVGSQPRVSFEMVPDLELTATFVPNPFIEVSGLYHGLFYPSEGSTPASSGAIRLRLAGAGVFTGVLMLEGRTFRFSGKFNSDGHAQFAVLRRGLRPLVAELELEFSSQTVRGTITEGTWTAQLQAIRSAFDPRTNPAPNAGPHEFTFEGTDASTRRASGTFVISSGRTVSVRGAAEDRRFSFSTGLGADGRWPFYISWDRGREVIIGWVEAGGSVLWMRSEPGGFTMAARWVSTSGAAGNP